MAQRNSSNDNGCIVSCCTPLGKGRSRLRVATPSWLSVAAMRHPDPEKKRRELRARSHSCTSSKRMKALSRSSLTRLYSAIRFIVASTSSVGPSKRGAMRSRSVWKSSFTKLLPARRLPTFSTANVLPTRLAPRTKRGRFAGARAHFSIRASNVLLSVMCSTSFGLFVN